MPQAEISPEDDWREQRRLRAWELHQQGWIQRNIADELGVTQGAVSQWLQRVQNRGLEGLRHHRAPGKRAKLTNEQFVQLPELIARGPKAFGFQGSQWTTARFAEVLKQVFGVSYHPGHVSRLLKRHVPGWRNEKKG